MSDAGSANAWLRTSNRDAYISSLPNEILAFIFTRGQYMTRTAKFPSSLQSDSESAEDDSLTLKFEVALSHVTSHWRNVAINEPFLWNNICVSSRSSLDELIAYLERSRKCLLNLRLDLGQNAIGNLGMHLLTSHVGRWRTLSTESNGEVRNDALLTHLRNLAAPNLVHISMSVNALKHLELMPNNIDDPFPQIFTGGAPVLSFVRLACHALSFFRPPLTAMTTLHLDQTSHLPMSYTRFCQVITASPALTNLSIYGDMIGTEAWPLMANSIELPALRSLRICGIGGLVYCGVLLNISAPGLESLILKDVLHNDLDQLWDSPQMFKFPVLQSLTFCGFECTESTYRKFFSAFPTVTHFTSLHSSLYNPRVLKLVGAINSPILLGTPLPWPKLHTMSLLFNLTDEASLVAVVNTRIHQKHPIAKLRLGMGGERNTPRAFRLVQWLQKHLQVEWFSVVDPWPIGLQYVDEDDVLF